jgi:hypothetical protein
MRVLRFLWLGIILQACGTGTVVNIDDPQAAAEVRELIDQYYRDFNSRDWEAVAGHFWLGADITMVWQAPGEKVDRVVHTSIDDFVAAAPRENPFGETFETWRIRADVSVYRNLAQAWVRYGAKLNDEGEVEEWDGVDAFTLLKHDDVWKIAALMFASDDQ